MANNYFVFGLLQVFDIRYRVVFLDVTSKQLMIKVILVLCFYSMVVLFFMGLLLLFNR